MAWSAPMTAVANAAFTAAQFNTHVRDNLNETAPAKADLVGGYFIVSAVNAITRRNPEISFVTATETTASTSFVDLATPGPSCTRTASATGLVIMSASLFNDTNAQTSTVALDISGAHTEAPSVNNALEFKTAAANQGMQATHVTMYIVTPGSSTYKMKYSVSGGTGSFRRRKLIVMPF